MFSPLIIRYKEWEIKLDMHCAFNFIKTEQIKSNCRAFFFLRPADKKSGTTVIALFYT